MNTALNVMFVDDEQPVLDSINRTIRRMGRSIFQASYYDCGKKALAAIEREQPDVLVTDMKMPGMSGARLLQIVKLRFPGIKLFVLSGQRSTREQLSQLASNIHFLDKPFDTVALVSLIIMGEGAFDDGNRQLPVSVPGVANDQDAPMRDYEPVLDDHPAIRGLMAAMIISPLLWYGLYSALGLFL